MGTYKTYLQNNAGITEAEYEVLAESLATKTIAKGSYVLRQREVCKHSFFVESGLLRSYTIDNQGKEHIIQFAPENWYISDRTSLFCNEPSELFIDAIEETTFVFVAPKLIDKAIEMSPSFRQYNEKTLHNHIRHMQNRVNLLLSATAEVRYLNFIKLYPDLTLRVPQWMIASYLGITPESLSRVRKELAHKNFNV